MRGIAALPAVVLAMLAAEAGAQQPVAPTPPVDPGGVAAAPKPEPDRAEATDGMSAHHEMMMRHGAGRRGMGRGPELRIQTDELTLNVQCSFQETTDQCAEAALKVLDRLRSDKAGSDGEEDAE